MASDTNYVGAYTIHHVPTPVGEGTATSIRTLYVVKNWKGETLYESWIHAESNKIAERFKEQFNAGWVACGEKIIAMSLTPAQSAATNER